ncbi:hypothetical protein MROS_0802 [Melioribacter roseus P3M-2]|uniref:Uncharacterized protein n=1 Tax=Melioribacter roseus (strain DSM 23840 / JCM 17771 / VKM B-2668 / P3M-2) TaxID=1191523 RepID=I6ZYE1_MELRP|nr:hypothetical protein [Melioribacter roseus]AFN74043.1 hypothetical protein MROS_0802 [Melioribacter roseus P3M-2]
MKLRFFKAAAFLAAALILTGINADIYGKNFNAMKYRSTKAEIYSAKKPSRFLKSKRHGFDVYNAKVIAVKRTLQKRTSAFRSSKVHM